MRAEVDSGHDLMKAERAFRRMLEDAKALDAFAREQEADESLGSDPGKWTRVLVEDQRLPGGAERSSRESSISPVARLREALEAAIKGGESVARTVASSDAKTISQAVRRLGLEPGSVLAAMDGNALAQLLRLADAFVSLVEQGRGPGKALPGGLRSELESRISADLGDVRIHDDPAAADAASRHGAVAFAQGADVFFANGMYDPASAAGKRLIAHEVTHVVQQRGGARAASGAMSEPGSAVEREADRVASAFAAGFAPGAAAFAVNERAAAGTISRKTEPDTGATGTDAEPKEPKDWKLNLLGQTLDLSGRLAGASDIGGGSKRISVNQNVGPVRIESATFHANGDKIESGTLAASIDSGSFRGTSGTLTVNSSGQVSGTLTVPINAPGLFVKQVSVEVGPGSFTGKARLAPGDFQGPDFQIKTSDFELTVSSTASGISVGLSGTASVAIDNGMAQGGATMAVDLKADSSGVSFTAKITGKIVISGLATMDATLTYDGKKVEITAGAKIPVDLPGLAGTAIITYDKGKLALDSKDLHFTLPALAPVMFDEVHVDQAKVGAKLHLGSPIKVPLPGGASLTLEQSSITVDGTKVSGDVTGTFALNNAGGLTGKVQVAYDKGDFSGTVAIAGGAKFTLGGVEITIDSASKLNIEKGQGLDVSGDIAGKIKIGGLPEIALHVIAKKGAPIDITCSADIPLKSIVSQLGGNVHVQYHRDGGANAFSLDATNIQVFPSPVNGQVVFSKLSAHLQGKEVTGVLAAASGTQIKAGSTTVTILGGAINLLPGRILHGHLQARTQTGDTAVEATVGWNKGKFDWSAEGNFDIGPLTGGQMQGSVHAAAGSDGTGLLEQNGPITFTSPALSGIVVTKLYGNRQGGTFKATIKATDAIARVTKNVQKVDIAPSVAELNIAVQNGKISIDGKVDGTAQYPKGMPAQLKGNFHLAYKTGTGFTGTLDGIELTAAEFFKSQSGTADLETGKVELGQATFKVPNVCDGTVTTANVNVKTGDFQIEADVNVTVPLLKGLKIKAALKNNEITATLTDTAPTIPLGTLADLKVGAGTTITLAKGTGLTAHLNGTVDAHGLGNGTFKIDYENKKASGSAHVHVNALGMFEAFDLDLTVDENRKASTSPIPLKLASEYTGTVAASATVTVTDNKLEIKGRVTELKNLGSISDAFSKKGAEITYDQKTKQVTVKDELDVGGTVFPQLDSGSTLTFLYAGKVFSLTGTLKPKSTGAITFSPGSQITASWTSSSKRLTVAGHAEADIAELCKVDLTVDAGLGGGQPGTFGLRGHLDPTRLAQGKIKGVTFSSVTAEFSVLIGQGQQKDLNFHLNAQISGIPAAGVRDISASIDANYKNGQGISGTLTVSQVKLGDVIADGKVTVEHNRFTSGSLHVAANFPALTVEGTAKVGASEMGDLTTSAELKVTPGGTSPLAKFIQSGNIRVELQKWKLTNAVGELHLVPPSFLPIENTVIKVGYSPEQGLSATLSTQFNAPMAKHGEKGNFVAGYDRQRGLYAHIDFPITVPGFQAAKVAGDLDGKGIHVSATLIPKDAKIISQATVEIGYEFGGGFYVQGSITLKPSEQLELVVGIRYEQGKGLQVMGITPNDKAVTPEDHEVAKWHKDFPTIPLATVGVASLGLKFGFGVAAGYRMPRIKFKNPKLEGGLEALDQGGMPAFTFGGEIAMGAYISLSLSVQIAGEIQLLIATASAGIGAEIAARLNLELGATVDGRFAPGQGALLQIDPFVGASLDLIASLIATLHAEVCWFTIIDKKWTLASATFAHIDLGRFHPFNPVGLQIGGPGGTRLTNGLSLRDDAFDQIITGVKEGAKHAGDEEANKDARDHVAPVLRAFKNAAHQFEQLPAGWENGMTAAPVDFHSMFPVKDDEWDYYQDHADTAEKIDPADACVTPTQKLAKAVGITARKDPGGAGRLILAWRRAQIANKGVNPDTGVNVVQEREQVQALIEAKYQADLLAAQQKQKEQDAEWAAHVKKQESDYQKAETTHVQTSQQQRVAHDQNVAKTDAEWTKAQDKKVVAAKHAKQEGATVKADEEHKAPPPAKPAAPPAPKPLAKPAPIPKPPPVPLPPPPEVLPAVTLPALPSDPGVSVHAAAAIPPSQKQVPVQSPGAKSAPTGGTPDPMPGTQSNAKQAGGGGGGPMPGGKTTGAAGGRPSGGSTSAAPPPGPVVAAGPDGIISQQNTLDAKKRVLEGGAAGPANTNKPGLLGKLGPGTPGAKPAAAGKPTASGKPAAASAPGKASTAPAADTKASGPKTAQTTSSGLDPTVQKVVDQGKTDEAAYKTKLDQQAQTYKTNVTQKDKATEAETKKLEQEAEAARKRKEAEKAALAGGPGATPAPGKPGGKPKGPIGTRVAMNFDGESHTLYVDENSGIPMVASTPTPVTGKVAELSGTVGGAPSIKPLAASSVAQTRAEAPRVGELAAKASGGDAAANSALTGAQQALAGPLKITWAWAKVAVDPAVSSGSIDKPLLHPYYPTFKGRVAQLSSAGHLSVDATPFAESTWTKICKAVKAASPNLADPAAYSNLAKHWLDMKSPQFVAAISQFEHLGKEIAKAGSSGFSRARNFGFWSKDEGRSLAEAVSDLTLETSAIGGLMDGLPTLNDKDGGWDPEIWGALSNAYATAVVPELLKGKKVNVCVGAEVPPGNIWDAVESEALTKGLKGTKLTLDKVSTHYAAAAKTKANRRVLDDTKQTNGIKGCLFVGDRPGAIAAANAHFKTLDAPTTAAGQPGTGQPASGQPLPPGAPIGTRVPMTVGGQGHTQYIDPSGKPMVASTPTPVTDKLTELNAKLKSLPKGDPKFSEADDEIKRARALEGSVAKLAEKVKAGTATAADLTAEQGKLAVSVAKIWDIADPGPMDPAKAKQAIDARAPECADISAALAADWVHKSRADFESHFLDTAELRHAVIAKHLTTTPDKAKIQTVGSKDPIALQKFKDIDAESHLDPKWGNLKDQFYQKLGAELLKPTFTDRTRTYPAMKDAAGFAFNCKGTAIPANRISPLSARNHSVEKLYDNAKGVAASVAAIDNEIATAMTAKGAKPAHITAAKANEQTRRKAYRHLLKSHPSPLSTIDKTKSISPFPTWYAPGEIKVNASALPNKEFARMMTLGALQPEWYPTGTAVLNIDRRLSGAPRFCFKPTAFDGLMSALWTARNMTQDDYGVTGGGVGEFLEANVPFSDVTQCKIIIPTDDFIADIQRVMTEVSGKAGSSTPTEEILRGNNANTRILNTTGASGVRDAYGQVIDRSAQEQNQPSASPAAPNAALPTSSAKPGKPAAAEKGPFDRVEGPRPNPAAAAAPRPVPTVAPTPAGTPEGLSATSQAPGVPRPGDPSSPSAGGAQANDGRTPAQTAAGAPARPEFGGKPGESVADAATRLHPDSDRDSHFNPAEKVAFERALAQALLARGAMYDAQVNRVSAAILRYFEQRLADGIAKGVDGAHEKYVNDLASLTKGSRPGWWGAVEIAAGATKEELANQTRQSLTQGSLPQKMAVHQNFINILQTDFKANVAQAFLGAAAVEPWYVRQKTKLKDGKLDASGVPVFDKAHKSERGRVERPDQRAVSPAAPGIEARGDTGAAPGSVVPAGSDPQQVYRGLDSFTMDEAKAFCQRARLKINMPLAAGVSGSTAELINVAMTMGLAGAELQKYAIAVLAYIGGGGNHSYHEIAIVLAAAGLKIDPDTYAGVESLVGRDLFEQLKTQHPAAFHDPAPDPTGHPPPA